MPDHSGRDTRLVKGQWNHKHWRQMVNSIQYCIHAAVRYRQIGLRQCGSLIGKIDHLNMAGLCQFFRLKR